MQQSIGFVKDRHGKAIAYGVTGRGRPLVADTGFVSHLELQWAYPPYRRFFEALSSHHRVIRFDLPGIGLGDPTGEVVDFEDDVAVLEDLVDGLGLSEMDLFGASQAGAVMVAYAARHPERIGWMVIFGGYADGPKLAAPALQESLLKLTRAHWGIASQTLADIFIAGGDEQAQQAFASVLRVAATPDAGVRRLAECFRTDIRDLLPKVKAPVLVIHRTGDRNVGFEHGRALAAGIPGAQLVSLEGRAHVWYVGDMESVLAPMLDFLGDKARPPRADSVLSAREREVALLISQGLSNGEVASRLGISARTAEAHAEHIRNKLGFRSRAQIAAWAVENVGTGA